jgi:hypothetical protein
MSEHEQETTENDELEAEDPELLPNREAMSIIAPDGGHGVYIDPEPPPQEAP